MYVLDDPHVNLIQLAGWQFAQVSDCQHTVSGLAAVFWDQVANCAADGEPEGALAAPKTWSQKRVPLGVT